MEDDQFSSDEFDFPTFDDELALISGEPCRESNESSGKDSDAARGMKRRKLRIIENGSEVESDVESEVESDVESEVESEVGEGAASSKWVPCGDYDEVLPDVKFKPGQNPTAPQIMSKVQEPIDFFKLFFTNELAGKIIRETNTNAEKKFEGKTLSSSSIWRNWRDVTEEEFWAFLAVVINMGTMPLDSIKEYWAKNVVSHVPFYPETFTRDRFSQIFWMLHLETISTHNTNPRTRLKRISSFLDYLNSKLLDYFIPGEHIVVDESTINFKGRICLGAYDPKRLRKGRVRVYALADSKTGYICCILPYYGSLTTEPLIRPDLPVSSRIPLHLYQMLLGKIPGAQGHHMYTDRHHTSYALAQELAKLKCSLTGTILTNRKGLPMEIKGANFPTKSLVAYRRGDTLLLGWKDKRVITCLTTKGDTGVTVKRITRGDVNVIIKKPNIALNYVKHMGSVDRGHKYASSYCFLRKSLKWWRKLFFWGMEISLVNSYLLYKQEKTKRGEKPVSQLRFRKTLVEQLRGPFRQQREQASTSHSDDIRLNGKLHTVLKGPKRDCKVCSDRSTPGRRREVSYYCDTCPSKPRLHLGHCFTKYHTKTNYRV